MTELRVERGGHRVAFLSKFHVTVDGEEVAQLKHGESATLDVTPGIHSLHVHVTGLNDGSIEIDVPDNGTQIVAGSKQGIGGAAKSAVGSKPGLGNKVTIEFWSPNEEVE